jgi:hypothetical protein
MSCYVMACHVTSCHFMPCHVISCHVTSCHVISCHAMLYHVMLCYVKSSHFILFQSYHIKIHWLTCLLNYLLITSLTFFLTYLHHNLHVSSLTSTILPLLTFSLSGGVAISGSPLDGAVRPPDASIESEQAGTILTLKPSSSLLVFFLWFAVLDFYVFGFLFSTVCFLFSAFYFVKIFFHLCVRHWKQVPLQRLRSPWLSHLLLSLLLGSKHRA